MKYFEIKVHLKDGKTAFIDTELDSMLSYCDEEEAVCYDAEEVAEVVNDVSSSIDFNSLELLPVNI